MTPAPSASTQNHKSKRKAQEPQSAANTPKNVSAATSSSHQSSSFHRTMSNKHLRPSTQEGYQRKQNHFKNWLQENHYAKCFTSSGVFTLKHITKDILHDFIDSRSLWKENQSKAHVGGGMKSKSVPEAYHAAIVDFYKQLKTDLPFNFDEEWKVFISGYKKTEAEYRQQGLIPAKGSDNLSFEGYCYKDVCLL